MRMSILRRFRLILILGMTTWSISQAPAIVANEGIICNLAFGEERSPELLEAQIQEAAETIKGIINERMGTINPNNLALLHKSEVTRQWQVVDCQVCHPDMPLGHNLVEFHKDLRDIPNETCTSSDDCHRAIPRERSLDKKIWGPIHAQKRGTERIGGQPTHAKLECQLCHPNAEMDIPDIGQASAGSIRSQIETELTCAICHRGLGPGPKFYED